MYNLKVLFGGDVGLEPRRQDLRSPGKSGLQGAGEEPGYIQVCSKGGENLSHEEMWQFSMYGKMLVARLLKLFLSYASGQLILKEIHPEYSLKGLILKSKLLYFGHLI